MVEDIGEQDRQPLMDNGPIFEQSPGNIILDEQEGEEHFYKLINDLKHHNNDEDKINYVPDNSDGDCDSLGSWEAEYTAMDKEEGVIVTNDDIPKEGDISDHEYGSNESVKRKKWRRE